MQNDERNFRSSYYEKVGCRSVEEKKSIEILFKDKYLDKNKIGEFCLRFNVPITYRNLVWQLLFGVIPVQKDCQKFVYRQREIQYNNLFSALLKMKMIKKCTPKGQVFLKMWLLEKGNMRLNYYSQLDDPFYQHLFVISNSLLKIFENDVDVYWISKGFFECIRVWYENIPNLAHGTRKLLKKEDNILYTGRGDRDEITATAASMVFDIRMEYITGDWKIFCIIMFLVNLANIDIATIFTMRPMFETIICLSFLALTCFVGVRLHLLKIDVILEVPIEDWFCRCFAGTIHESALVKIWDKVVGGSFNVLMFVCIVLLTTLRRVLLKCQALAEIMTYVCAITEETSEVIANKSIDLWHQHGRHVMSSSGNVKEPRDQQGRFLFMH